MPFSNFVSQPCKYLSLQILWLSINEFQVTPFFNFVSQPSKIIIQLINLKPSNGCRINTLDTNERGNMQHTSFFSDPL
jgi:hypothetical protein